MWECFTESKEEILRQSLIGKSSIMVGFLEAGGFGIDLQVLVACLVRAVWNYFKRGRIVRCQGKRVFYGWLLPGIGRGPYGAFCR